MLVLEAVIAARILASFLIFESFVMLFFFMALWFVGVLLNWTGSFTCFVSGFFGLIQLE